jgi:hypothetical protein
MQKYSLGDAYIEVSIPETASDDRLPRMIDVGVDGGFTPEAIELRLEA